MTKEQYKVLLYDLRWKELSLSIKKRDKFKCKICESTRLLQVHHKVYISGLMPWEYSGSQLVTLCERCHKNEHKGKTSKDFLITNKRKKETKKRCVPVDYKPFQVKLENSEEYYKKKNEAKSKEKLKRMNGKKRKKK